MKCSILQRTSALVLLAAALVALPAESQGPAPQGPVTQGPVTQGPVTVAVWSDPAVATLMLVDRLPAPGSANSGAVLVRRPGDPPNNIIIVTHSTSARELAQAVTALAFSRRRQGDQVPREMRTAVAAVQSNPGAPTRDDRRVRDERRAEADLRRLRLAPEFDIPGLARGPAVMVRMADSAVSRPASGKPTAPAPKPPGH